MDAKDFEKDNLNTIESFFGFTTTRKRGKKIYNFRQDIEVKNDTGYAILMIKVPEIIFDEGTKRIKITLNVLRLIDEDPSHLTGGNYIVINSIKNMGFSQRDGKSLGYLTTSRSKQDSPFKINNRFFVFSEKILFMQFNLFNKKTPVDITMKIFHLAITERTEKFVTKKEVIKDGKIILNGNEHNIIIGYIDKGYKFTEDNFIKYSYLSNNCSGNEDSSGDSCIGFIYNLYIREDEVLKADTPKIKTIEMKSTEITIMKPNVGNENFNPDSIFNNSLSRYRRFNAVENIKVDSGYDLVCFATAAAAAALDSVDFTYELIVKDERLSYRINKAGHKFYKCIHFSTTDNENQTYLVDFSKKLEIPALCRIIL